MKAGRQFVRTAGSLRSDCTTSNQWLLSLQHVTDNDQKNESVVSPLRRRRRQAS